MSKLLGDCPQHLRIIGVQTVELEDYGGSLRPAVMAQLEPAMERAVDYLRGQGIATRGRQAPLAEHRVLSPPQLEVERYEQQRLAAAVASRGGDERGLADRRYQFAPKHSPLGSGALSADAGHRGQYPQGDR